MNKWQTAFEKFHAANPQVYEKFCQIAYKLINDGHQHFASGMILYQIVWLTRTQTVGSEYKINMNFGAYYSRKFAVDHPKHADFFRFRKLQSEGSEDPVLG